jgi:hypothetical protein
MSFLLHCLVSADGELLWWGETPPVAVDDHPHAVSLVVDVPTTPPCGGIEGWDWICRHRKGEAT